MKRAKTGVAIKEDQKHSAKDIIKRGAINKRTSINQMLTDTESNVYYY